MKQNYTPAKALIEKCGGLTKTARLLELPVTTVQGWWNTGRVPSKHQTRFLIKANKAGFDIEPSDFFEV